MSKSQRKREKLKASQMRRAKLLAEINPRDQFGDPPYGAVLADHAESGRGQRGWRYAALDAETQP